MSEELRTLLVLLAVAIPIGLAVGIGLRKLRPDLCKRYAKFCLGGQWKLFAFGFLLFGFLAAMSFMTGRAYFGALFIAFSGLQLFALLTYGFKPLTPAMEERIDESDPTRLLPWRFWKRDKSG